MKTLNLLLVLTVLLGFTLTTQAEVPKLINYQGKLTTAQGGCIDTTLSMQFSIYTDSIHGDLLWSETQSSVKIREGIFNVLLGSVTEIPDSVFTGDIRYLGVKVEDDLEMTPRKAIVSVGYAYRTSEADTAWYARTAAPDDDWQTDTSGFDIYRFTGNVGIGTIPQDSCKLFVLSSPMVGNYAVYASGRMGLKAISTAWEGTGIEGEGGHAGVAGNGYFSGNVGIGTTEPDENLEVDGNAHITGDLTVDGSINTISLKVYDSGWFAVQLSQVYILTHNLGTTKVISELWFSTSSDGSDAIRVNTEVRAADEGCTASLQTLTSTHVSVATGVGKVAVSYASGQASYYTSGYYRLILLALE